MALYFQYTPVEWWSLSDFHYFICDQHDYLLLHHGKINSKFYNELELFAGGKVIELSPEKRAKAKAQLLLE